MACFPLHSHTFSAFPLYLILKIHLLLETSFMLHTKLCLWSTNMTSFSTTDVWNDYKANTIQNRFYPLESHLSACNTFTHQTKANKILILRRMQWTSPVIKHGFIERPGLFRTLNTRGREKKLLRTALVSWSSAWDLSFSSSIYCQDFISSPTLPQSSGTLNLSNFSLLQPRRRSASRSLRALQSAPHLPCQHPVRAHPRAKQGPLNNSQASQGARVSSSVALQTCTKPDTAG